MGSLTTTLLSTLALCVALLPRTVLAEPAAGIHHDGIPGQPGAPRADAAAGLDHALLSTQPGAPLIGPAAGLDHYDLHARLLPEQRQLQGRAQIVWRNRSSQPLTQLIFHLYANAFRNEHSVFMREAGASLRATQLTRTGGIDVTSLRSGDGADLLAHAARTLIAGDTTQLRVELAQPLPPDGVLTLECTFVVQLPSIVARMGAERDFFMLGQWFPKLAKLEPNGQWASFPYHGLGEFYADFADYDLHVEVPADHVVAAPGELIERAQGAAGTRREHYRLNAAVDVAWAASPHLERVGSSGAPTIEVFAPPGVASLARGQARLLRAWLATLGARLGAYPYTRFVLILPPGYAIGAAGMEYPGLILGWPVDYRSALNPWAGELLGLVSAHELAHQWFALLLASDEVQAPVLDEGLAQWVGLQLMAAPLGRAFFMRALGLPLDLFELTRLGLPAHTPSSLLPAPSYRPDELGAAVYVRPALSLESIARCWGQPRLWGALGRYARAQRYGHPALGDLWAAFDAEYWPGFAAEILRPALEGESFATRLATADPTGAGGSELLALRSGAHALPTSVEVVARDGTRAVLPWPAQRTQLPLSAAARAGVSVDPDRHNLLDPDRSDDQLRQRAHSAPASLSQRVELLAQALLMVLGL